MGPLMPDEAGAVLGWESELPGRIPTLPPASATQNIKLSFGRGKTLSDSYLRYQFVIFLVWLAAWRRVHHFLWFQWPLRGSYFWCWSRLSRWSDLRPVKNSWETWCKREKSKNLPLVYCQLQQGHCQRFAIQTGACCGTPVHPWCWNRTLECHVSTPQHDIPRCRPHPSRKFSYEKVAALKSV